MICCKSTLRFTQMSTLQQNVCFQKEVETQPVSLLENGKISIQVLAKPGAKHNGITGVQIL